MRPILRPITRQDIPAIVRHANNPRIADRLTDAFPHPMTVAAATKFVANLEQHQPRNVLAITLDDELIGAIGVHPKQDVDRLNAEMGYWLSEDHWGKGIVSSAIPQMVDYCFAHFPVIERIFARPYGDNPASQRVLEKAGFVLEARFHQTLIKGGERKDELIFAIRRKDWSS